MKTARELVDDAMNPYSNEPGTAEERIVRAIEARDRETVEACGKIIDRFGAMSIRPSMRDVADAIRSLSPKAMT